MGVGGGGGPIILNPEKAPGGKNICKRIEKKHHPVEKKCQLTEKIL